MLDARGVALHIYHILTKVNIGLFWVHGLFCVNMGLVCVEICFMHILSSHVPDLVCTCVHIMSSEIRYDVLTYKILY